MTLTLTVEGRTFDVAPHPFDCSIPLLFDGPQPSFFGAPPASARPYAAGGFVGDVRAGGSCNVMTLTMTPHCNGTHTECVGHITQARVSVSEVWPGGFVPATLITVAPVRAADAPDTYRPDPRPSDRLLAAHALEAALADALPGFTEALIIRTLPNDAGKQTRDHDAHPAPYCSIEAMAVLHAHGVRHLLLDTPSVDRPDDGGRMTAHHLFWGLPTESRETGESREAGASREAGEPFSEKTITEMIFVPDALEDGPYLLAIEIPPFVTDAAPSRPLLFRLNAHG